MMKTYPKFSLNLAVRKRCNQEGIRLSQFAQRAGISATVLYDMLYHDSPSIATCERCARGFGITLPELIREGYPPGV